MYIKFNNTRDEPTVIDWEEIRTDKKSKSDLNYNLITLAEYNTITTEPFAKSQYTTFNTAILTAAKDTATKQITKNQGWFHHSNSMLIPAIHHRDRLLHHLRSQESSEETTAIRAQLQAAQVIVTDYVTLDKAAWSLHQA